jgi:hypothetical protein
MEPDGHRIVLLRAPTLTESPRNGRRRDHYAPHRFAPTQALTGDSLDVPYVPTLEPVVDKMLDFAKGFRKQDLFDTDLSKATVLTMYLLPRVNLQLRPRILNELKPGTRVVSHSFDMGDWKPDQEIKVDGRTIYIWDCT